MTMMAGRAERRKQREETQACAKQRLRLGIYRRMRDVLLARLKSECAMLLESEESWLRANAGWQGTDGDGSNDLYPPLSSV